MAYGSDITDPIPYPLSNPAGSQAYAATGVDYLAIGSLTHSAPALDIGLDFRKEK